MGSERKSDAYRALARDTFPRSATNSLHFPLAPPPLPVQGRASSWRAPRGGRRVRHGKDATSVLAGWFEPMKSSLVCPDEVYGWGQKDASNLPVATVSLWPDGDIVTRVKWSLRASGTPPQRRRERWRAEASRPSAMLAQHPQITAPSSEPNGTTSFAFPALFPAPVIVPYTTATTPPARKPMAMKS